MFRVEAYIERCLLSCVKQDISLDQYEIICVDDGSPDNSRVLAEKFAQSYSNVIVISQANGGLSAARNTGIEHATGDYILFLDSDDWIESNCLGLIINTCGDNDLDLLRICAADVYDGEKVVRRFSLKEGSIKTGRECLKTGIPICAPFTIYKRELLNKYNLRFYNGIFHEDNEFSPRVYYHASRVGAINKIVYYVFLNPNSITRTINSKKSFDSLIVMERLHDFSKNITDDTILAFHFKISEALNVALFDALNIEKNDVKKLDRALYEKRYLLAHLKKSKVKRFIIEWLLFKLNPRHIVETYRFLIKLDYRKY